MSATVLRWVAGRDTGISSVAIWSHMMTGDARGDTADPYTCFGVGHPVDAGDFGRCYRLLALEPAWRARLNEMARYSAEWKMLTEHWPELEAMYEAALVAPRRAKDDWKRWSPMCDRMQFILAAARVCANCGKVGMSAWTTHPGDVKVCYECEQIRKAPAPAERGGGR